MDGQAGESTCTCEFHRMSNLRTCKHAVAFASAKGVAQVLVESCKKMRRTANKALFHSKFEGKKPGQAVRTGRRAGGTLRTGMLRLEPVISDIFQPRSSRDDSNSSLAVKRKLATDIALVGQGESVPSVQV